MMLHIKEINTVQDFSAVPVLVWLRFRIFATTELHQILPRFFLTLWKDFAKKRSIFILAIIRGTTLLECQEECHLEFDGDPQGKLPLKIDLSPRKLHLICGAK